MCSDCFVVNFHMISVTREVTFLVVLLIKHNFRVKEIFYARFVSQMNNRTL